MKKKVLFALIALFSFLSSWAAVDVTVGDYTVTLNTKAVAVGATSAPEVTKVMKGESDLTATITDVGIFNASKTKVTALTEAGTYYKLVFIKDGDVKKALYVPFSVVTPTTSFIRVNSAETFATAMQTGGAYDQYYEQYPWCDVWYQYGDDESDGVILYPGQYPSTESPTHKTGTAHAVDGTDWTVAQAEEWATPLFDEAGEYRGFDIRHCWYGTGVAGVNPDNFVWVAPATGQFNAIFTDGEKYDEIRYQETGDLRVYGPGYRTYGMKAASAFGQTWNLEELSLLFAPATDPAGEVVDLDWALSRNSLPYNAQDNLATIKTFISLTPAGTGVDFTVKAYQDNEEVTAVKDYGTYKIAVFVGEDEIGERKDFNITSYTLTLGSSITYKQIGDPEPDPVYSLIYDNTMSQDAANLTIEGLKLVRKNSVPADDVVGGKYEYYIDSREAVIKANGVVTQNYQIGTSSAIGILEVTKKLVNDDEFYLEVADAELVYDKTEKKPVVTVYRRFETGDPANVTEQFDITFKNNINADAYGTNSGTIDEPEYAWMTEELIIDADGNPNRAIAIATPKAEGIFTETLEGVEPNPSKISPQDFKIRQRQITAADVVAVADQVFINAIQTPAVTVKYTNSKSEEVTLENADYTTTYGDATTNKWVTNAATYTVEAVYTGEGETKTYTGNYWDKVDGTFKIVPFEFTLQPVANQFKILGTEDPALTVEGVPVAAAAAATKVLMGNNDATVLSQEFLSNIATWDISRATGEFAGVFDITISDATLNGSETNNADPAHNYIMHVEGGAFEITQDDTYYVSSIGVTREFKSNDTSIPFDEDGGFYLYRKVSIPVNAQNPNSNKIDNYYVISPESELYKEIVESGRITGNELVTAPADQNAIQPVANGHRIQPIIEDDEDVVYDYALEVLPQQTQIRWNGPQNNRYRDNYSTNREGYHTYAQNAEDGLREGFLFVTPRKVTIIPDNAESVYGEDIATLTAKVYAGHITAADADKLIAGFNLVEGAPNAANTIGQYQGLSTEASTYVPNPALTTNMTFDIVVNNQNAITSGNPNYDIQFGKGTYTLKPTDKTIAVSVDWTTAYGSGVVTTEISATLGGEDYNSENIPGENEVKYDATALEDKLGPQDVRVLPVGQNPLPTTIDGYPVTYKGTFTTVAAGELVIIVSNQGVNYPADPTTTFEEPYVKVTGPADIEDLAELGLKIKAVKPATGYVKNGGELKVEFNNVALGTKAGEVITADKWPWVANYEKVTVKSGKIYVTAEPNITLDIAAFNKPWAATAEKAAATYTLEQIQTIGDKNDQLIRDYAGSKVNSVTVTCSLQGTEAPVTDQYKVKGNQWYSMVLPFKASPRDIQKLFNDYAAVDVLNKKNEATKAYEIRFTLNVDSVPANEPFVAKTDLDFVFKSTTITAREDKPIVIEYPLDEDGNLAAVVEDGNENQFIGTYKAFFTDDATSYNLINLSKGDISPATKGAYVRPLGGYIKVASGVNNNEAPLRITFEEADGTTTVIEAVEAEGAAEVAYGEGWYTITGVKLDAEPTTSGTYIFNGKKVFIQK